MSNPARSTLRFSLLPLLLAAMILSLVVYRPVHAQSVDDGLVGYWPFDEGSGATSADASGNGNTATLHTPNSFTNNTASTDFANPFALASSNSANSYATAPGTNIDGLQQLTLAFWVRINANAPYPAMDLIGMTNGKIGFGYYDRNNMFLDMTVGGLPRRLFRLGFPVADGRYHHFAGSFDGTNIRFYVDGRLYSTLDTTGNRVLPTSQGVVFSSPTAPLDGALDDVRIYNRALSDGEVAALAYNCANAQGLPAGECRALVTLFRDTDGANWTSHTGWLENNTPCSWFGVLCNNGHVIVLNLPQNQLRGALSPVVSNFPELIVLNLANNQLTGALPFELSNLSKLQTLDLYGNQLGGQLPFTLGNMTQLQTLRLYNNQLRGPIPSQLANMNGLLTLDLGYNMLNSVDANLVSFLNNKQPNWAATQTLPPANLQATIQAGASISVTWEPISYTADSGYYEVLSATQGSGIYSPVGKTADKSVNGFMVSGLAVGQTYSFLVRTFTPKHDLQQNDLLSDSTDPIAITVTNNHPPVAGDDSYSTPQDTALTVDAVHGLLANDSDPDGNQLKIGSIGTASTGGKLALTLDGSFTYTPALGYVGTEIFNYQASDGQALSNQATIAFQATAAPVPQPATITIALDVQPDSKTNFAFTGNLGAFALDDITPQDSDAYRSSKTFTVPAGVYTVTEQPVSGYLDANISCNPPAGTIADLTKHQIVINAPGGGNITCTFAVQRAGEIIAGKYNDRNHNHVRNFNDEWLNGWQIQMHSPFSTQTVTQVTAGEGRTLFSNLFAGTYTVCEVQQTGWINITPNRLDPNYNQPCYTVTVAPGQAVWMRFGNGTTPLVSTAEDAPFGDIIVCDLPATDDDGNPIAPERDPWEEEEAAGHEIFLPVIQR